MQKKEKESWDMEEVMVQDFGEFLVVGINNNTSQLSEAGLEKLKELWAEDKPIILTMHFLLNSSYGLLLITFSNYSMINPFLFSDALIDPLTMHCGI